MFNKFLNFIKYWLKFRIYFYLPFFKNRRIKFGKRTKIDIFTTVYLNKNSTLIIGDHCDLRRVKIRLNNSSLILCNKARLKKSNFILNNSNITGGNYAIFLNNNFNLHCSSIKFGDYVKFERIYPFKSFVKANNATINIGDNNYIAAKIQCENSTFTLKSNSFINEGTEVRCYENISIGNYVLISYECLIFDTNTHSTNSEFRKQEIDNGFPNSTLQFAEQKPKTAPINIGDRVWIGMRAVIFKNSKIGNNSIIGANSVLANILIPENSLAVGNPCNIKKRIPDG